jgi:eukaryotic-like serine/threonine-protein kinase
MSTGSPPRQLGRYQLMFLLGQGGMGEVHLARLTGAAGFEKLCIVKTILPAMQADPQFVERFHHEARVLVQLTHAHIAQVHDMGEADGTLYMAIEYVPGVDLSRVLRRVAQAQIAMPIPIAIHLGKQVAEALGYAHRKTGPDGTLMSIVHRDVSPQNVMVSYDGDAKVIDFGLAKSAGRSNQTMPSTVMGKLGYMSPEQAVGKPLDSRSDIYSAGIVLWEMLAGRPLFGDGTMSEMVARMAMPQVPSLRSIRPDVSETLDRVVLRALAVSPVERYGRADELSRALNEIAVRESLSVGSEEVGNFVRAMCPEEFAAERQLQSRLSQLRRAASPAALAPPPIEPTSIKSGTKSAQIEGTLVRNDAAIPMTAAQKAVSQVIAPVPLVDVVRSGPVAHSAAPSEPELRIAKSRAPLLVGVLFLGLSTLAAGAYFLSQRPSGPTKVETKAEPLNLPATPQRVEAEHADDKPEPQVADTPLKNQEPETPVRPPRPMVKVRPPIFKIQHRDENHYVVLERGQKLATGERLIIVGKAQTAGKRELLGSGAVVSVKGALAEVLLGDMEESEDGEFAVREEKSLTAALPRPPTPKVPPRSEPAKTPEVKTPEAKDAVAQPEVKVPPAVADPPIALHPFPVAGAPTPVTQAPATAPSNPVAQPVKVAPAPTQPVQVRQMPTIRGHIDVRRGLTSNFVYVMNDNVFTLSDCYVRLSNGTAYRFSRGEIVRGREFIEIDQRKFAADPAPPTEDMRRGWSLMQCREGDGYVATRFARGQ